MLKPGMQGSGINQVCKSQLLDPAKALKPGMPDQLENKVTGDVNKTINRIVYNLALKSIRSIQGHFFSKIKTKLIIPWLVILVREKAFAESGFSSTGVRAV